MASKEWTQQQRERADQQVRDRHNVNFLRRDRHAIENDLQCELNEARELLLDPSRREKRHEWISRNK